MTKQQLALLFAYIDARIDEKIEDAMEAAIPSTYAAQEAREALESKVGL